jgi:F-type H+-transporting ATPase subunit a
MNSLILAAGDDPLNHVYQWVIYKVGPDGFFGFTILSNHTVMQMLAALILVMFIPMFVKPRNTGDAVKDLTPSGIGRNFIETICNYLREEVVRPNLAEYTDRFVPFIWTVFFYILTINILGLLPIEPLTRFIVKGATDGAVHHGVGGAATGNIIVTATLAFITLAMIVVNGLRIGGKHFIAHFCPGPLWLAPLLVLVEIVGLFAKVGALAVRLFANMVAGHVLLAVMLSFVAVVYAASGAGAASGVGVVVVLAGVAFNLLELFVAFLQAFIFTFLTTLFIGQSIVFHHDDHHDEAHEKYFAAEEPNDGGGTGRIADELLGGAH